MQAVAAGFRNTNLHQDIKIIHTKTDEFSPIYTPISYGILRGTGDIFQRQMASHRDFWEIDLGYFHSGHFAGYYRISKNGMRATYNDAVAKTLPFDRWDALNINIAPYKTGGDYVLICPPSEAVCHFYGIPENWLELAITAVGRTKHKAKVRYKNPNNVPLAEDLERAVAVVAYSSNVMIDALIYGVPAIGQSPDIYNWNGLTISDIGKKDLTSFDRLDLFRFLSYCQFTLNEFCDGSAWKIAREVQNNA